MAQRENQINPAYIREAREIYAWLVDRLELAGALIRQSTRTVLDQREAAAARFDLHILVTTLAVADPQDKKHATWERYKHHFIGDHSREKFSSAVGAVTRRIASAWLVSFRPGGTDLGGEDDQAFKWDDSLLPSSAAPHVLRLAILHPGVLEYFLPRFFERASELLAQKSTYRRKVRILDNVPKFGWSAEKHAAALKEAGDLDLSEKGSEVETVKKLIRDLRDRYRKYLAAGGRRPRL